jgi:hypothetical protein
MLAMRSVPTEFNCETEESVPQEQQDSIKKRGRPKKEEILFVEEMPLKMKQMLNCHTGEVFVRHCPLKPLKLLHGSNF